jgi:hypothetical protein
MRGALVRSATIVLAGLLATRAIAMSLPIEKGESFARAREALLRTGWIPVRTSFKLSDGTPENNYGDAALLLRAGFPEVQFCSGTGNNYCVHNYRRGRRCLRLATLGEYGVGPGPEVEAWYFECPRRLP